ncbi:MAG: universal stress protein [Desulfonatronovibrio sp.]
MFNKIIHPVDLSESISDIKIKSSFITTLGSREIILVHVLNPGLGSREQARSRLSHLTQELGEFDINARFRLCSGHVASEIARAAEEEQTDGIYMPASAKNFLVSSLMGSVTHDVLRLSEKPVFVHKQRPVLTETENLKKVVFATDFGEAAKRVWPYIKMLGAFVSELIILHVGKRAADPYTEQIRRENVQARMDKLQDKFQDDFKSIKSYSRIGSPARHIIQATEDTDAELVALGRMNEPFPSMILGSTSSRVTAGVKSSVLLIP